MKRLVGLLHMEHRQYSLTYIVLVALAIVVLAVLPHGFIYFYPHLIVENVRLTTIFTLAVLSFFVTMALFIGSLQRDAKAKDVWLHNPSSIYTLVGAKMLYHLLGLLILEGCIYIGFFFVGTLVKGTITQFIIFAIVATVLTIAMYALIIMFVYFFTVLYMQGHRYIGKLSSIILFVAIIAYFELLDALPTLTFLHVGEVNLTWLERYTPNFGNDVTMLFFSFYVLEEFVMWGVLLVVFIGTSKWLERVLTR